MNIYDYYKLRITKFLSTLLCGAAHRPNKYFQEEASNHFHTIVCAPGPKECVINYSKLSRTLFRRSNYPYRESWSSFSMFVGIFLPSSVLRGSGGTSRNIAAFALASASFGIFVVMVRYKSDSEASRIDLPFPDRIVMEHVLICGRKWYFLLP